MRSNVSRRAIRQAGIVVAVYLIAGAFCGWLWHHIWAPAPKGFAYHGYPRFDDDLVFRSTGLCLVIGLAAGLLIGLLVTWLFEADEVFTLGAVVVGSLLAGWLMVWVGSSLGPESMFGAAKSAKDFDGVRASLEAGPLVPWVAFPGGSLLGSVLMLVCFTGRHQWDDRSEQ